MASKSQVTISVCIPTIEPRTHLLNRALESVYKQTRLPESVLVELDAYREGPAATRNKILFRAETDYVAWLDDDDEFLPHHIQVLERVAVENDADLVYPWHFRFDNQDPLSRVVGFSPFGRKFDAHLREFILTKNNFIPITTLIRTELLKEVGGFPLPWSEDWPHPSNEDWGCWKRLLNAGAKFTHAPNETWLWHPHGVDRRSTRMYGT